MKNRHLQMALALVVLINILVLAGVAYNRSNEPEASLVLTERELGYYRSYRDDENSGMSLSLDWNRYYGIDEWFDEGKLATVGFDLEHLRQNGADWSFYQRQLPRKAYVVLELEGEAWSSWVNDQDAEISRIQKLELNEELTAEDRMRQISRVREKIQSTSRLFAMDIDSDPERLRQRYPDRTRYAVVSAEVRVGYERNDDDLKLYGRISQLLVDNLHVPLDGQTPLLGLPAREYLSSYDAPTEVREWYPRYTVTVNWGQRYEPWVEAIELTAAGIEATKR